MKSRVRMIVVPCVWLCCRWWVASVYLFSVKAETGMRYYARKPYQDI